ncbi:MAG: RNA pseudouridine synthase, partial [Deltaproteobacteria bacterium]|nr:RNA pseudouridine synthase [Deltaproteobacteria bacterium]
MAKTDFATQDILKKSESLTFIVPDNREGQRLDHYLVEMLPAVSRSRLAKLIREGFIRVNNGFGKAGNRLKAGDTIDVNIPPPEQLAIEPEKVFFEVLFEDNDILVIAKPPGVVVHPAAGHKKGTLVHG